MPGKMKPPRLIFRPNHHLKSFISMGGMLDIPSNTWSFQSCCDNPVPVAVKGIAQEGRTGFNIYCQSCTSSWFTLTFDTQAMETYKEEGKNE